MLQFPFVTQATLHPRGWQRGGCPDSQAWWVEEGCKGWAEGGGFASGGGFGALLLLSHCHESIKEKSLIQAMQTPEPEPFK